MGLSHSGLVVAEETIVTVGDEIKNLLHLASLYKRLRVPSCQREEVEFSIREVDRLSRGVSSGVWATEDDYDSTLNQCQKCGEITRIDPAGLGRKL